MGTGTNGLPTVKVSVTGSGEVTLNLNVTDGLIPGGDNPELDFHSFKNAQTNTKLGVGVYTNAFKYMGGNGACAGQVFFDLIVSAPPNAGSDATIQLCLGDPIRTIHNDLGGTPDQANGTWSGTGVTDPNSGYQSNASPWLAQIDPSTAQPGTYVFTWTVTDDITFCPCADASASVTYIIDSAFDPGTGGVVETCL
jgi:hypothetical protein